MSLRNQVPLPFYVCSKQEPSDIEVEGMGKLKLHSNCKGYEARILIQAQTIVF